MPLINRFNYRGGQLILDVSHLSLLKAVELLIGARGTRAIALCRYEYVELVEACDFFSNESFLPALNAGCMGHYGGREMWVTDRVDGGSVWGFEEALFWTLKDGDNPIVLPQPDVIAAYPHSAVYDKYYLTIGNTS